MSNPILFIIAGCNGSGKSSLSKSFVPLGLQVFDFDYQFMKIYTTLFDTDIRETMAYNMAMDEFENQIEKAISNGDNFSYETNFNANVLLLPKRFKNAGYKLHIIYLCLNSIEEAQRRVAIRVANGGHFVSESEINKRYLAGFANLNAHFKNFDVIDLFDNSAYATEPRYILSMDNGNIDSIGKVPEYLKQLIPVLIPKLNR